MKKKLFLFGLLFTLIQSINGQTIITGLSTKTIKYVTYYPTKSNPNSTITDYVNALESVPQVGVVFLTHTNPDFERDNFTRSRALFHINLAENEKVDHAELSIEKTYISGSGSFNITLLGNTPGETPVEIYDETASGSLIGSMNYSSGEQALDITGIIRNDLLYSSYYFGFYEGEYGCAQLIVKLKIWKSILQPVTIYVKNNFPGGAVKALVGSAPTQSQPAPVPITALPRKTVYVGAVEPQLNIEGYDRVFNDTEAPLNPSKWEERTANNNFIRNLSYYANTSFPLTSAINNYNYVADMKKAYKTKFQTNIIGVGNNIGTIVVGGTNYSSPTPQLNVVENNSITATFPFEFWYDNIHYYVLDGQTVTVTPDANATYTKNYFGTPDWPSSTPRNLSFGYSKIDDNLFLTLMWNEHPNTNVSSYQIWRHNHHGYQKIGTVNRGTTTFIDYQYLKSSVGVGEELTYDVLAYYSPEQSLSINHYCAVWGSEFTPPPVGKGIADVSSKITDYSLTNYPNPFNPTTRIEYQLPKAGQASIKVYNSLGKEVATLVNEHKEEGKYFVEFNGAELSSGIYFCELRANEFVTMKKMLLVK